MPLEVSLFTSSSVAAQIALQQQVAAAKTLASNGATVGISVVFGSSLMNLNPTSFFDFMNTAEILYSVYLFNVDLYPALTGFLLNLNPTNSIPNIYTFIVDASQGAQIPAKYNKYGYNNNLLVLNAGTESTTITVILAFFIIVSLLSCSSWVKKKLTRFLQYFKYGVFLRFWIQTYLNILESSIIGILYTTWTNTTQIINFCLCVLAIVFFI